MQKLEGNGKNSPRANCSLFTHAYVCVCLIAGIMPDKDQLGPTYKESRTEISG